MARPLPRAALPCRAARYPICATSDETAVVSNSEAGLAWHRRLGYRPRRALVIPNGYDTSRFRPDPEAGAALRRRLGWPADAVIVGMVARVDPAKDHAGFLEAIGRGPPALHAVLIGQGTESLAIPPPLAGRVAALGVRADVAALTAGFDIACLASFTEGFPNVVAEAMACGVPCVITDSGGVGLFAKHNVNALISPPGDAESLASHVIRLLEDKALRQRLSQSCRSSVMWMDRMASARATADLFRDLLAGRHPARSYGYPSENARG